MHALKNGTHVSEDMYVSECQDSSNFDRDLIKGKLLICSYSIRFVLGLSTVKQASQTVKNLSAAGVIFYMDSFVLSFRLNPTPMRMPGIIISSPEDSKVVCSTLLSFGNFILLDQHESPARAFLHQSCVCVLWF